MPMRKVLVHLVGEPSDRDAMRSAVAVAAAFGSHLEALFLLQEEPRVPPSLADESSLVVDVRGIADEEEGEGRRRGAEAAYRDAIAAAGVPEVTSPLGHEGPTARWREVVGPPEVVALEARLSDLVVFGHVGPDAGVRAQAAREAAIAAAGRPLLLTPPALERAAGEVVGIAWNGGERASRAVLGAMPFLRAAREVHVVSAETARARARLGQRRGDLLVEYLSLHGVPVTRSREVEPGGSLSSTLLDEFGRLGVDLAVMGCSGHGGLRGFVLGDVSREMIRRSAIPLLVAH